MKKFCVAYTNLFENNTEMTIVEAETGLSALAMVFFGPKGGSRKCALH